VLQQEVAVIRIGNGDHVGQRVAEDEAGDGEAEHREAAEPIRFGVVASTLPRVTLSQRALSFGGPADCTLEP
jgi:hypothetical protein